MYEHTSQDWHGLHMLQTKHTSLEYLQQVRGWLDQHPKEVVGLLVSKHGNELNNGTDQYPGVSVALKQTYWAQIEKTFSGLMFDTSQFNLGNTSINDLIKTNQRLVVFASDYIEFTNSSRFAFNAAGSILETTGGGVGSYNSSYWKMLDLTANAGSFRADTKARGQLWMHSSSASQGKAISDEAKAYFEPLASTKFSARKSCAAAFKIPETSTFCPDTLLGFSQLLNYYRQFGLYSGIDPACQACDLPNVIVADALDQEGTIRTGLRLLTAESGSPVCDQYKWTSCASSAKCDSGFTANGDTSHLEAIDTYGVSHDLCVDPLHKKYKCCRNQPESQNSARFAYVATFIRANLNRSCKLRPESDPDCVRLKAIAQAEIEKYPVTLWEDGTVGRHAAWPANSTNSTGR
eukprot:TRINITY_DN11463_c0_g1_i6.p1 TRINITY_DN11463_c0_g1~~TRINITY_DN11463_c0_g1_i6.p1  ORF type:complete len:406 (-),score=59.74 TRINITY_DN11463_c0_g1_i6:361-1578(-)